MYIKSIYTNQVYKVEGMPKYSNGYILVSEKEYKEYIKGLNN